VRTGIPSFLDGSLRGQIAWEDALQACATLPEKLVNAKSAGLMFKVPFGLSGYKTGFPFNAS
jgi:hypothetical protein